MTIQEMIAPLTNITLASWLLAGGAAIASYVVMHAAVALFRKRLCRISDGAQADSHIAELLKATLARTSNVAVVITAFLIGLSVLDLPPPWGERVRHLWFIALGAQFALYLDRAITVTAQRYFRHHATDPEAPATVAHTLMIWAIKTVLWVVFLLAVLSNLGIDVTTLVASLGIGGIAVALAVQNILGDLFASLSIAVDKPFEVGDAISVDGISGTVEHVGLKTTRIRADSGEQVVIANAALLKNTLRNFKRMSNRRVQFSLKVSPGTTAAQAAKVPEALRAIIEQLKGVRFDRAHLKGVNQDALEFDIVYHVLDPSYARYMDIQQAVLLASMDALDSMGIATDGAPRHVLVERVAPPREAAPPRTGGGELRKLQTAHSRPAPG